MAKLNEEARMTIKTLARKGVANREIARLLGVTEGTVRYQRRRMESGAVDGRTSRSGYAAAFADAIDHWHHTHEEGPVNLALLHEWLVTEFDYGGSLRSVQRYYEKRYPAPQVRARRRIETPPGAQGQVDWAVYPRIVVGGRERQLYGFHLMLSHSRQPALVWSPSKKQIAWHHCHLEALRRIGGVPATLRVDNEKTAVARGAGAWGTINTAYRRFARLLRFHIDACAPRHPQAKGKVERLVRTCRLAANPAAMTWNSLEELQEWTDEQVEASAGRRRCPSTGTSIHEAWMSERELLTPLPEPLWQPFDVSITRRVGVDGLVSFEGRQYSVPFMLVGEHIEVHGCSAVVQFFHAGRMVTEHERATAERILIRPEHYDGESTARVKAPQPLGKMGRKMLELAAEPVTYRSIDYYQALAEVAR